MGKLVRMPSGGVVRRDMIKRFAAKTGLTQAVASKMRTRDIVAWLRQHRAPTLVKTGT
jgi:hypothetical protein